MWEFSRSLAYVGIYRPVGRRRGRRRSASRNSFCSLKFGIKPCIISLSPLPIFFQGMPSNIYCFSPLPPASYTHTKEVENSVLINILFVRTWRLQNEWAFYTHWSQNKGERDAIPSLELRWWNFTEFSSDTIATMQRDKWDCFRTAKPEVMHSLTDGKQYFARNSGISSVCKVGYV